MFFQRLMLKESLVIMSLGIVFGNLANWKFIVWHHDIYYAKKIKLFPICWDKDSSRKVKYIWSHFSEVISKNMLIGNDFFVFKYPVKCTKIQILNMFIKIKVTVWMLCAHP